MGEVAWQDFSTLLGICTSTSLFYAAVEFLRGLRQGPAVAFVLLVCRAPWRIPQPTNVVQPGWYRPVRGEQR